MPANAQPDSDPPPTVADDRQKEALRAIKAAHEKSALVIVVGAGVTINSLRSVQTTVPPQVLDRLTWPGLLEHGLGYVREVTDGLSHMSRFQKDSFEAASRALQKENRASLNASDLISIAGLVKDGLRTQNQLS